MKTAAFLPESLAAVDFFLLSRYNFTYTAQILSFLRKEGILIVKRSPVSAS